MRPVSEYDNGPRPFRNGVLLIAMLGVVLSTWVVTELSGSPFFTYDDVGTGPVGLRQKAMSAAIGFLMLSLAAVAMRGLGAARWLITLTLVAGLVCAVVSVKFLISSPDGPDIHQGNPWWSVVRGWVLLPTTWPILIAFTASLPSLPIPAVTAEAHIVEISSGRSLVRLV